MRALGMSLTDGETPWREQMRLIADAGFDCTFFDWDADVNTLERTDFARNCGLSIDSLHAPFGRINSFWEDTQEGADYHALMFRILDECAAAGIDKLVMHTTVGNHPPQTCERGFIRYRTMCDYAKEKGVHICFENLEPFPHLHEILAVIDDPFHGFCWDCGHNLCYTPHVDMMARYADRLMCLHLHDNNGVTQPGNIDFRDDLHMLPFDGVLDWEWTARKIADSGYTGPLTFEYSSRTARRHADKPYGAFVRTAKERAVRLRDMIDNIEKEIKE